MPEKMDEIEVGKHFKMKSPLGVIEGHSSNSVIGVWARVGSDQIGIVIDESSKRPYITFYETATAMPNCVMTTEGIQLFDTSKNRVFTPWAKLADALRQL